MTKFNLFAAALLIAGIGTSSVSAFAAGAFDTAAETQSVRTDDLNLTSQAGVATLNQRIRVAARMVCGEPSPPVSLADMGYHACVANAMRDAHAKSSALIAAAGSAGSFTVAAATPGR